MKRSPFAFFQEAALAAAALRDETAGSVNASGMELHKLQVLQWEASTRNHSVAVASAGMRAGRAEVGAAVSASGDNSRVGDKPVQRAVLHAEGDNTPARSVARVHDEVEREVLDKEAGIVLERLAVQGVQNGVAGAVRGGSAAMGLAAFAEVEALAAEGALVDAAVLGAREGDAITLEFEDGLGGLAAHVVDGVLVAEEICALDGVEHMPAPVIGAHVTKSSIHAAPGGDGVRAGREELGDGGGLQTGLTTADCGAETCAAGTDDNDIDLMIDDIVAGDCRSLG